MSPIDRVVILTGATQGIGLASAQLLAEAGCRLALAARSVEALHRLSNRLNAAGYQTIAVPADLADPAQAAALVAKTVRVFGRLDVVINNAAVGLRDLVADLKEPEHRRTFEVNYFGPVALIQAALPPLRANPGGGLIINISSIVGRRAMPGIGGYCASKGALQNLADSLRVELAREQIRVSTIYPGVTATRFNDHSLGGSDLGRGRLAGVPPERVARAILRTIEREPRDVYITLFDRLFVTVSLIWPGLMDRLLSWRYRL
ncbi:MAG TPA: SDR family NAD(P)-dependent oxidoreductase [Anaerolineae bacterium]|nr:SDR family NAD(P)-dependent oxidoreductase [Anaerolineae bacterium]